MSVVFAWLVNRCAGSVVEAFFLHTGINFRSSIIPVLPTDHPHRPYALIVAMLVLILAMLMLIVAMLMLIALMLLVRSNVAGTRAMGPL